LIGRKSRCGLGRKSGRRFWRRCGCFRRRMGRFVVDDGIAVLGSTGGDWRSRVRGHGNRRRDDYYRWHVGFDPDRGRAQVSGLGGKLTGDGDGQFFCNWPAWGFCWLGPCEPLVADPYLECGCHLAPRRGHTCRVPGLPGEARCARRRS
jgi:hypothetical protein